MLGFHLNERVFLIKKKKKIKDSYSIQPPYVRGPEDPKDFDKASL